MKVREWIIGIVLLLLVAAAIAGLLWTRALPDPTAASQATTKSGAKALLARGAPLQNQLVDQRPLLTARMMSALATTAEEQSLAHEALKLGDHEVDLAFTDALRQAADNPVKLTPEMQALATTKAKADAAVKADQENIVQLTRQLAGTLEAKKDNTQDQLDVAKAQLELDQDELDDATEDLERAGGDPQTKIKRLMAEHEASGHDVPPTAQVSANDQSRTLLAVTRNWYGLRGKAAQLDRARQEALDKIQYLTERHSLFSQRVEKEKEARDAVKQQAAGFAKGGKVDKAESRAVAQDAVESLKHYTDAQKNLADHGRRIQDEQELSDVYANWMALVEARERAALHGILQSILWILLVALAVYVANRTTDHFLTVEMANENKRFGTLRSLLKFGVQVIGLVVVLFIVLGMPTQTATILGFAGAGLTVAMKDFIVAFFGWFVLMGKNGIHVGDWVEIDGVGGEVVEVGLLKTVVLETGNWTDAGHPTGRKVSFVNSFAIEGHFFNFTTSGQWMWDELQFSIPGNEDPYTLIDGLQKVVAKETEANAKKAEQEWESTTSHYNVKGFSAEPAISVRPTGSAVELRIRYITRASDRHETRRRLYEAVVELMHGKRQEVAK